MQKKEALEIAVTTALVTALIFFTVRAVKRMERIRHKKTVAAVSLSAPQAAAVARADSKGGLFARFDATSKGFFLKRDPFSDSLMDATEHCPHGLCLKGIVWSAQNPSAIINDGIVKVGDETAGDSPARVVEITEHEVVLDSGSELIRLSLD